jgi:hypothetical protein
MYSERGDMGVPSYSDNIKFFGFLVTLDGEFVALLYTLVLWCRSFSKLFIASSRLMGDGGRRERDMAGPDSLR